MGKMKDCVLLDNSMFDDGSIECKNFQVSTLEDYRLCEWDYIEANFPKSIQSKIVKAINAGKSFIGEQYDLPGLGIVVEISWD